MSQTDGIAWCDATWNPVGGCSVRSPGCKNCYAMKLAGTRLRNHPLYAGTTNPSNAGPVFNGTLTIAKDGASVWDWPRKWAGSRTPRLGMRADGEPRRSLIFVGDMSDLFHESREVAHLDAVFDRIRDAHAAGREHVFQLLTKRPVHMADYVIGRMAVNDQRWSRLWLGTSAEDQERFDERWPHLERLASVGFTVFISYEPALGPLVLPAEFLALGRRAWVIVGGESGRRARSCYMYWFQDVLSQCQHAGVPCFVKQLGAHCVVDREGNLAAIEDPKGGEPLEWPLDLRVRQFPDVAA